ncbi:hypothetical protein MNBD_GAMMA03-1994, partial [hydrothermal vent metagenome]
MKISSILSLSILFVGFSFSANANADEHNLITVYK